MTIEKARAEIQIQAMMFDMDIDWETFELMEKKEDPVPVWARRYREKRNEADFCEYFDIDNDKENV